MNHIKNNHSWVELFINTILLNPLSWLPQYRLRYSGFLTRCLPADPHDSWPIRYLWIIAWVFPLTPNCLSSTGNRMARTWQWGCVASDIVANETHRNPKLPCPDCVFNILNTLHEYAEVGQWWLSSAPNCVGLEGLSESSVTSPVCDSSDAYTLLGFTWRLDGISMRFVGKEHSPWSKV